MMSDCHKSRMSGGEGGDFVVGEARPPNSSSPLKGGRGSVGEGETGKKAKTTPDAGGKSVSEKSQATRTSKNVFEKSKSNTQYTGTLQYM